MKRALKSEKEEVSRNNKIALWFGVAYCCITIVISILCVGAWKERQQLVKQEQELREELQELQGGAQ